MTNLWGFSKSGLRLRGFWLVFYCSDDSNMHNTLLFQQEPATVFAAPLRPQITTYLLILFRIYFPLLEWIVSEAFIPLKGTSN